MTNAATRAGGWRGIAVCRLLLWLFAVCAVFEAPLGSGSSVDDNASAGIVTQLVEEKRASPVIARSIADQSLAKGPLPGFEGDRSGDLGDEVILPQQQRLALAVPERLLAVAFPTAPRVRTETGAPGARAPPSRG